MFAKVVIIFVSFSGVLYASEECNKDTAEWYKYKMATKTAYRVIANTNVKKPEFEGCTAKKIWMTIRHGTRNPGSDTIIDIQSRLPKIRNLILKHNPEPSDLLRNSDLYNLANWTNDIPLNEESYLTEEGEMEALELAERMQVRFPELFPFVYSNDTYLFKHTNKQRTKAMAKFFATGLFGREKANNVQFPKPLSKDPILEFYKLCDKWLVEVDQNPKAIREKTLFEEGPVVAEMVKKINKDLRLNNDLTLVDVETMHEACRFETAWNEVRKSPWCSVFDEESLKAMEYIDDLKCYYVDGYGTELNYKQACPAFKDMFHFLKGNTNYPQTVLYFTHSGMLLKLIAHLGLYKDQEAPKHDNFMNNQRRWRSSSIGSFGTTLTFVSLECGEKTKVALYHQEKLVKLPACKKELCDLDEIEKYYHNSIYKCNFDDMCSIAEG